MTDLDRLLMIVPSRGRPSNVKRLMEAFDDTREGPADMLICVDEDDPKRGEYQQLSLHANVRMEIGPRLRLGGTLNEAGLANAGQYFALGFMGDDHRPRTQGWDQKLIWALQELGSGIAYGNDLIQGPALPTAVGMTSDIVATLGYMVPAGLVHLYIDSAWKALGEAMGRFTYLPDVIIEHLHPIAGKALSDAGYEEVNAPALYVTDGAVYQNWCDLGLKLVLERLRAAGLCA